MPRTVVSRDDPMNSSDEVPDDSNTAGVSSTNEQSKVPVINVTESEIDAIDDIMTALEKCEQHRVVFNDFEHQDVSSLRLLLKCSLLCKGTSRADIEDTLNKRQHFERPRMDNLCAVYKEALQLITENDKLFCYTLHIEAFQSIADNHNNYNAESLTFNKNIITDFNKYIYKLQNYRSPILVLGETGAGKTSFINLLLGERLLPSSLLSNTHTICELGYSHTENIEAEIEYAGHPTGSSVKKQCFSVKQNNFVHFIKAEVESTNVQKITLQGPFNILKNNVVIVDSPGVGESPEMNDVILGYVEKAAAFVFVIDMMNAGGVQQRVRCLFMRVLYTVCNSIVCKDLKNKTPYIVLENIFSTVIASWMLANVDI